MSNYLLLKKHVGKDNEITCHESSFNKSYQKMKNKKTKICKISKNMTKYVSHFLRT